MYNNRKFYKVIETQIAADGGFADLHTDYTEAQRQSAYANFYQVCAAAALNAGGLQYHAAQIVEYGHERAILLESKVFDYREDEPAPAEAEDGSD